MILAFDVWAMHGFWGAPALHSANTGQRETQLHPGKSAVAGMLGAALGIERRDLPELCALLRVACRTDAVPNRQASPDYESTRRSLILQHEHPHDAEARPTTRFEDLRAFERVNGGQPSGSILSKREYWTTGGWTVFVHAEAEVLERMEAALVSPWWQIYAGRTCCPLAFPPGPRILDTGTLDEACRMHPGLHRRLDSALSRGIAGWRVVANGAVHWEEGFPAAVRPLARRPVRQQLLPDPCRDPEGRARHLARRFGEYVECWIPSMPQAREENA